ncbi:AraC family transcriptional regulator [Aquimarina sp. AU474]|uniref:helix-turn-helix domain-containing protein n=1 Tax=Aquimarina sp. AU474 TaxID=2108529 RepID=UPI000D69360B|nr:AraC family transcriptional regulator [Aquimarina sp. AU474]
MARTIIDNIVIEHYENADFFEFCKYTSIRFFEVLHFEKGSGTLTINGNTTPYSANTTFVFVPDDIYIVEVETKTTVTTIKFLRSFFSNSLNSNSALPIHNWFRKIERVLHIGSHQLRALEFYSKDDKVHLASLIEILYKENEKKESFDIIIIENSLTIILHIISRNIKCVTDPEVAISQNTKIQDIIDYLHTHIYQPELLTNKQLAKQFNIADNYIGQYFKKYMDLSIKKYVLNYKLKLVETRLKHTDMQFSEIALELGFTDASHLNKTFLAYKGQTIGAYKNSLA